MPRYCRYKNTLSEIFSSLSNTVRHPLSEILYPTVCLQVLGTQKAVTWNHATVFLSLSLSLPQRQLCFLSNWMKTEVLESVISVNIENSQITSKSQFQDCLGCNFSFTLFLKTTGKGLVQSGSVAMLAAPFSSDSPSIILYLILRFSLKDFQFFTTTGAEASFKRKHTLLVFPQDR